MLDLDALERKYDRTYGPQSEAMKTDVLALCAELRAAREALSETGYVEYVYDEAAESWVTTFQDAKLPAERHRGAALTVGVGQDRTGLP